MRMQTFNRYVALAWVFVGAGCFGGEDYDYPALDRKMVIGCWVQSPGLGTTSCSEICFSENGKRYTKLIYPSSTPSSPAFVELYGEFSFKGRNNIAYRLDSRESRDTTTQIMRGEGSYTIIRDTLNEFSRSADLDPYVRRDSTHNCGPHWLLFQRPADWSLP